MDTTVPRPRKQSLTIAARKAVQRVMRSIDGWYQRRHRLRPLGPALHVGCAPYHGPQLQFADGTVLRENDLIGTLHFNNAGLSAIGEGSLHRTGFQFARLMRESLRVLADRSQNDPELSKVVAYHGITWLPEHGNVVGFESRPLPPTFRNRMIRAYLKLLLWTFAASKTRKRAVVEPRAYWLTRHMLAQNIGKLKSR